MKLPLKTLSAAVACCFLATTAAQAEWKVGNLMPDGKEPASEKDGLYLLAESADSPSLMFGCSDRLGVQARIYLDGMTQAALALEPIRRVKTRMVEINTESTEAKKDPWAYLRTKQQLISVKPWQGKRMYNAAVKGEEISLNVRRVGDYSLTLPEINDAFKTFASTCDATAPKQS